MGYVYGAPLQPGTQRWIGLDPPVSDPELVREDGRRTFGFFEIMLRRPWRGTGTAQHIHDLMLADRPEPRSCLSVDHEHPRVRAMYERWGYRYMGTRRPDLPDAPLLDAMLRVAPSASSSPPA